MVIVDVLGRSAWGGSGLATKGKCPANVLGGCSASGAQAPPKPTPRPHARKPKVADESDGLYWLCWVTDMMLLGPGSPWLTALAVVAHPRAPVGGCGPGNSTLPSCLGVDGNDANPIAHPQSPVGSQILLTAQQINNVLGVPVAKPPPKTKTTTFTVKQEQTQRTDILVKGKVLADGSDPNLNMTAITRLDPTDLLAECPTPFVDGGVVKAEVGKFTLKGTVTIRVLYDTNGSPKEPARYGRGTTREDIKNGDTTAGFHESCHVADYVNWLKKKPLPVFKGKVGMSGGDYNAACDQFDKDLDKYFADATSFSVQKTDEVGRKKSQMGP